MSRIILNTKIWLFVLLFGMSFPAWAQSDDFNTWTKFKVNHKIDSRFSVSGDLELRMKDDVFKLKPEDIPNLQQIPPVPPLKK